MLLRVRRYATTQSSLRHCVPSSTPSPSAYEHLPKQQRAHGDRIALIGPLELPHFRNPDLPAVFLPQQ